MTDPQDELDLMPPALPVTDPETCDAELLAMVDRTIDEVF
jgi:hypothetical protein